MEQTATASESETRLRAAIFLGLLTILLQPPCVVVGLKIAFWLAAKLSGIERQDGDAKDLP
jgi:hypothetical protein